MPPSSSALASARCFENPSSPRRCARRWPRRWPCAHERELQRRRERGEGDVGDPERRVAAAVLDGDAAEPGAEEAADLVHEHDRAEQARQALDAETARQQLGRRRQRRHVSHAHRQRERQQHGAARRRGGERGDGENPQAVHQGEQRSAREALHEHSHADAAGHVGGTGDDEPQTRERRRQAAALDHARHVNGEEGDVEAAGGEAAGDQPETRVAQRFAFAGEERRRGDGQRRRTMCERARQRQRKEGDGAERAQRRDPAVQGDRERDERREQQLPGGSAGADHAGGEAALGRRGAPADLADEERVAGDRGAGREDDEHQEDERDQGVDEDEQRRAEREQARAAGDDARRAEASCQRFDHRQGEARGELPEGRRQRDRRHAEAGRRVERRQEHAERRPAA